MSHADKKQSQQDGRKPALARRLVLRPGRLITVDGIKWKWLCGKGGNVIAYSERGQRALAKGWVVKGTDSYSFDRGRWKKTLDGTVLPSEVATWLSSQNAEISNEHLDK